MGSTAFLCLILNTFPLYRKLPLGPKCLESRLPFRFNAITSLLLVRFPSQDLFYSPNKFSFFHPLIFPFNFFSLLLCNILGICLIFANSGLLSQLRRTHQIRLNCCQVALPNLKPTKDSLDNYRGPCSINAHSEQRPVSTEANIIILHLKSNSVNICVDVG